MNKTNQEIWEDRYYKGQVLNRYPFDAIVTFVMRNFAKLDRPSVKILDLGSGGGNHTIFLAKEGFCFYAIDYSQSAINHTRNILNNMEVNFGEEQLVCGDFVNLPFEDNFFDGIIDRQSLDQNKYSNIEKIVGEIYRTLKVGGLYFGINFSEGDPNSQFGEHLGNNDYSNFTQGTFKGLGHRHFFTQEEVKKLFSNFEMVDFKVKKVQSILDESVGSEEYMLTMKKN